MQKNIINKLSTAGVAVAVFGLVALSTPFSTGANGSAGYAGYAGYAGSGYAPTVVGSTGGSSSTSVACDSRVSGNNCATTTTTKEEPKKETTVVNEETTKNETTTVSSDRVVKMLGDKKFSLKKEYCQVSDDIANPNFSSNVNVSFKDIAGNSFESDIKRLAKVNTEFAKPVVSGTTANTFEPNRSITRAEFLAVVLQSHCIDVYKKATSSNFADLKVGDWKNNVVEAAFEKGIISGDIRNGKKVFRPNDAISKIEAIAILTSMRDLRIEESDFKHSYTDVAADWQNRVLSLVEYLEIDAKSSKFNPNSTVNRAKMTNYIVKTIELY